MTITTFVFDLDGTLAKSKGSIDEQMCATLHYLLKHRKVCVVSGGAFPQFQKQLIKPLQECNSNMYGLHCFPTSGTSYRRWDGDKFEIVYNMDLTRDEKLDIMSVFDLALSEVEYYEPKTYGDIFEDRGSQITFSALGQKAPCRAKKYWDPHVVKRLEIMRVMRPELPNFEIRSGGTTSIDVTRKGCDKSFAISKIIKILGVSIDEMVFFGDAIHAGGNDYAVYEAGVLSIPVDNHIDCLWKMKQFPPFKDV